MKIKFAENLNRTDSGKHKFLNRLAKQLEKLDVEVVNSGRADIFLHIGRDYEKHKCKHSVMRIDGLLFNTDLNYKKRNKNILKAINASDSLIYQGPFCKRAFEKFFGIDKRCASIFNGADPSEFLERRSKLDNLFFTHCNWRPHKRLKNTCDGFLKALEMGLDADLVIAGKADYKIEHNRIKYVGWIGGKALKNYLSRSIATVHLAWIDWCPNSMIESAIAQCPLIYSDSGGSADVGAGSGIPIKDVQWDFKPCQHYDPPILNHEEIGRAMIKLLDGFEMRPKNDLNINYIATNYLNFFKEILG